MGARDMIAKAIVNRIRAFHASPHDFDKFDISKVGTGQGAQSYGHGVYFAENPKVSGVGGEYWQEFKPQYLHGVSVRGQPGEYGAAKTAVELLEKHNFDRNAAANAARMFSKDFSRQPDVQKRLMSAADLLESNKQVGPRVYEVDIKARPEQFLDWDKPLAQQQHLGAMPQLRGAAHEEAYQRALASTDRQRSNQLWDMVKNPDLATGEFALRRMMGRGGEDAARASNTLLEAGVPGVRYLDQGSRPLADLAEQSRNQLKHWESTGDIDNPKYREVAARLKQLETNTPLTSNYVMFDDKLIDIMKKYAVPSAAAPLGALAAQDQYGAPQ